MTTELTTFEFQNLIVGHEYAMKELFDAHSSCTWDQVCGGKSEAKAFGLRFGKGSLIGLDKISSIRPNRKAVYKATANTASVIC